MTVAKSDGVSAEVLRQPDRFDCGPVEFIQKIDGEYGWNLSREAAEFLTWERTGWPAFWPRGFDRPADAFESQVRNELRCLADFGTFTPEMS